MAYLEQTQLTNEKDVIVNPGSEEALILLRRMVKLLEASGNADAANRQRVTIDAGTLPAVTTVSTVSAVTTVSTVTAVTGITNALPAGTNLIGYVGMAGETRIDMSRATFANAIRNRLTFS